MKNFLFLVIAAIALHFNLSAQEESPVAQTISPSLETEVIKDTVKVKTDQDTTIVRIGGNDVTVISHDGGTEILWGKDKIKDKCKKDCSEKFKGHWQGLDLGFNGYTKADYSMYNVDEFMSVIQEKSYEVGINALELNIGLYKSYIGLITGIGLAFNDYKFENPYTIRRESSRTEPVFLEYNDLEKTKLSVQYLNVPLLVEFQIPVNQDEGRIYINAGILGAVKIGSHTKVKHGDSKDKDYDGFNINSFKYDATARIGYMGFGLYAKYSLTPLFENGKGPELTPFTLGVSFGD